MRATLQGLLLNGRLGLLRRFKMQWQAVLIEGMHALILLQLLGKMREVLGLLLNDIVGYWLLSGSLWLQWGGSSMSCSLT